MHVLHVEIVRAVRLRKTQVEQRSRLEEQVQPEEQLEGGEEVVEHGEGGEGAPEGEPLGVIL